MESTTDKMDQKAMADLGPAESPDQANIREKRFDWPLCYAAEEFVLNLRYPLLRSEVTFVGVYPYPLRVR